MSLEPRTETRQGMSATRLDNTSTMRREQPINCNSSLKPFSNGEGTVCLHTHSTQSHYTHKHKVHKHTVHKHTNTHKHRHIHTYTPTYTPTPQTHHTLQLNTAVNILRTLLINKNINQVNNHKLCFPPSLTTLIPP